MRIIITGASSGIGASLAKLALAQGAKVAALDLTHNTELPKDVFFVQCDVTQEAQVAESVARVTAHWNQAPTALVHCAGIYPQIPSIDIDTAQWDHTFAVNVRGSMLVAREVARAALAAAQPASFVMLSSVAAERGEESEPAAAYAASKGAVVSLTKQLAVEWGKYGFRVNAIMPGVIDTPMTTVLNDPTATEEFLSTLPLRRVGLADEVARACLFLAGPDSSFITGAVLPVDGGFLAAA